MKLLKVGIITLIFLHGMVMASPMIFKGLPIPSDLKVDTVKHVKKIKKRTSVAAFINQKITDDSPGDDCIFFIKYSIAERLKRYPFSKAAKILAVSFRLDSGDKILTDTSIKKTKDNLSFIDPESQLQNFVLDSAYVVETKQLDPLQINKLTNIIYNTAYRNYSHKSYIGLSCFNPRNALIFYDKQGKIFDYLQICFECMQDRSHSGKTSTGKFCNQKYEILRHFFIDVGVKYGTTQR